jgi:hypothetical protein
MEHRSPSSKRLITIPVTACAALIIALAVSCGSKSSTTELVPAAGAGGLSGAGTSGASPAGNAGVSTAGSGGAAGSGVSGMNTGGVAGSSSAVCTQGDTRTCTGPGACSGGQLCGSDGNWGGCDCGAGGEGAGGANAGGSGGGLSAGDDPCPATPIAVDCSEQCGGMKGDCPYSTASSDKCRRYVQVPVFQSGAVVARTPSHPGSDPNCTCSSGTAVVYALDILAQSESASNGHIAISPPWYFGSASDPYGCEPFSGYVSSCMPLTGNAALDNEVIWTTDSNAPAININVQTGPCP